MIPDDAPILYHQFLPTPAPSPGEKSSCYLCASPTRVFLKVKDHNLLACDACGLVYEEERREGGGISEDQEKFLREYLLEEKSYARYFDGKLDLIEKLKKPGTLLDFGCGCGTLLRCARDRGWKVTGVEGSVPAAAHARSTGLDIREGIIENLNLSGAFDVVTAFQAIEHFADPVAFLRSVKTLLKPGGLAVLTTPDRRGFMGKLMGRRWFGYYNDEHVFFFDAGSFKTTLEKAGFADVVVTREPGRALSPSWVFTRLFDYYYTGCIGRLIRRTRPVWRLFDWIHLREPGVNLVAIGRND